MTIRVQAHQLVDPDPEDELDFMEEMLDEVLDTVAINLDNLGSAFHRALRMLGFRVHLNKSQPEILAALQTIAQLGVALFQRGQVGPGTMVRVQISGQQVLLPGGITTYHTASRWLHAVSSAFCLRDHAAQTKLAEWRLDNFAGGYDVYLDHLVQALIYHIDGEPGIADFLERAEEAIEVARVFPQRARELGGPLVAFARSVLVEGGAQMNERLAEGLDWYRIVHERAKHSHEAQSVVPLVYLGLTAIAHDRGMVCSVESDYLPRWVVEGSF